MTGLIFGTIVAAWAAVLVPMWLRRHDERNEARSVERFSSAMRVLSRRGPAAPAAAPVPAPGARDVVMPGRSRVADVHVTGPSRRREPLVPLRRVRSAVTAPVERSRPAAAPPSGRSPRVSSPTSRPGSSRPAVTRPGLSRPARLLAALTHLLGVLRERLSGLRSPGTGRTSLVVRRRRTLLGLLGVFVLVAVLAVAGVAPLWLPVVALLLLAGYVVHLRAQARVTAQAARRRSAVDQRTAARTARRSSTDRVRRARAGGATALGVDAVTDDAGLALLDDEEWEPRDVLLPTYVTKPAASRLPDSAVTAFWGDAARDDEDVHASSAPVGHAPVDETDEALDDELGAILERRRVVGE